MTRTATLLVLLLLAPLLPGCTAPHERARDLAIDINPLSNRKAKIGDMCRYRGVRTGQHDEEVAETWTLRLTSQSKGLARVDVAVLGPNRVPASPSPREPGFSLKLPTADAGIAATEVLRLFRRPELTTEGLLTVLDRDETLIDGSVRSFTTVVFDRTYHARELVVRIEDKLVKGTYRIVVVEEIPVLGLVEAELDEEWTVTDQDGALHTERRHDKLELVEARGATDSR